MIKLKQALTALALCAGATSHAAPQSMYDILQGTKRENAHQSRYLVAYGKVLARKASAGWTTFTYRDGIVVSEKSPEAVIGTYIYDRNGRLDEIQYTSGKRVRITYTENGKVNTVSAGGRKVAKFGATAPIVPAGKEKIGNFVFVQEGIEAASGESEFCDSGDIESATCVIVITGPGSGGGGGGGDDGSGGAGFYPRFPDAGGGGGHSGGGSGSGPGASYTSPEQCKVEICDAGDRNMMQYCAIAATTPDSYRRCSDKAFEFYSKCLRSCSNGDWTWLDDFNYVW